MTIYESDNGNGTSIDAGGVGRTVNGVEGNHKTVGARIGITATEPAGSSEVQLERDFEVVNRPDDRQEADVMRDELWVKHDVRSRCDGKMRWFLKRAGQAGYGTFWSTIEVLHYQNDHTIPLFGPEFIGIAEDLFLEPEEYQRILELAVEAGLFESRDGKLWQEKLKGEQASRRVLKGSKGSKGFGFEGKASMSDGGKLGGLISGMKRRGASIEEIQEFIQGYRSQASRVEGLNLEEREEREEREENIYTATANPLTEIKKKEVKKFDPTGKTKLGDWVYVEEHRLKAVKEYYQSHGLSPEDLREAIRALDRWYENNQKMRQKRTDDGKTLMGWPFTEAVKRRKELAALERQQSFNHGGK